MFEANLIHAFKQSIIDNNVIELQQILNLFQDSIEKTNFINILFEEEFLPRKRSFYLGFLGLKQQISALHLATILGYYEICQLLIDHGINIDLSTRTPDFNYNESGITALHMAAFYGNLDSLVLLHKSNANINGVTIYNETALHLSVEQNNLSIVQYLLDCDGIKLGIPSHHSNLTPLMIAIEMYSSEIFDENIASVAKQIAKSILMKDPNQRYPNTYGYYISKDYYEEKEKIIDQLIKKIALDQFRENLIIYCALGLWCPIPILETLNIQLKNQLRFL